MQFCNILVLWYEIKRQIVQSGSPISFVGAFGVTIAGFIFDIMVSYFFAFLMIIALFAVAVCVTITIKPPTSPVRG